MNRIVIPTIHTISPSTGAMPAHARSSFQLLLVMALALALGASLGLMRGVAFAAPGDLDPTFDGDGMVTTEIAGSTDQASAIAIQADGKVVAAGSAIVGGNTNFALTRYNPDGSLDLTFDVDGRVFTDFVGNFDAASAVVIQPDGRIVAAGQANVPGDIDAGLARYNADGSLDPTFDGDGKVITNIGANQNVITDIAIQPDGKIVAVGLANLGRFHFAVTRYNFDGSLDTTFDGDGIVITDFVTGDSRANGVAIQTDGKIVAAGQVVTDAFNGIRAFGLARYNPNGSLDLTFDGDGKVTTNIVGIFDTGNDVAIQPDGKIVAAGNAVIDFSTSDDDFALARYNPNGSLDPTFDGDGKVTADFDSATDSANAVAIQADGKIVTAGQTRPASTFRYDFALTRHNSDGSLDATFSGDGKVTTNFGVGGSLGDDQAFDVAIQADGRIVAAGYGVVEPAIGDHDFGLARYLTTGAPTPTSTSTPTPTGTSTFTTTPTETPTSTPSSTPTATTSVPTPSATFALPTSTATTSVPTPSATFALPTSTATTSVPTPSATFALPTSTATATSTPSGCICNLSVPDVAIQCTTTGRVHWTATVNNSSVCSVNDGWRAELQVKERSNGQFHTVATMQGDTLFAPGATLLNSLSLSDFCYTFAPGTNAMRVAVTLDSYRNCKPKGLSPAIPVCNPSPSCLAQ